MTIPDLSRLAVIPPALLERLMNMNRGNAKPRPALAEGEMISEGSRNSTFASFAGTMRSRGMSFEAIHAALTAENGRCDPPLPVDEVETIARSVARYEPDPMAGVTVKFSGNGHKNGDKRAEPSAPFPPPIPSSKLRRAAEGQWLWQGMLSRGDVTLLSALWKSGKTTLLAHLLRAFETGGTFCGLALETARVLFVTEEHENRWAERRDALGLQDHIEFIIRPFGAKPTWERWQEFIDHLKALQSQRHFDLIAFDPLSNLWPVRDENDAAQVQSALMPLHRVTEGASLLLVHHNRKGDGTEATASRGSGALTAFVDTIIELRRFNAGDKKDCRRVLSGYGRHDETPAEVVVEKTPAGYVAHGDRQETESNQIVPVVSRVLPSVAPGLTTEEIMDAWPEDQKPTRSRLLDALRVGTERLLWTREGEGRRGSAYRYWRP